MGSLDYFTQGYITQPVYACLTCSKQSGNMVCSCSTEVHTHAFVIVVGAQVGVCFGCYLKCHLEHDTVELYHKHGFRCDCGTAAACCACEFDTDSAPRCPCNSGNHYNHNYIGRFCWCDRSYDPVHNAKMVQCAACEDWFHESCIKRRFSVCSLFFISLSCADLWCVKHSLWFHLTTSFPTLSATGACAVCTTSCTTIRMHSSGRRRASASSSLQRRCRHPRRVLGSSP